MFKDADGLTEAGIVASVLLCTVLALGVLFGVWYLVTGGHDRFAESCVARGNGSFVKTSTQVGPSIGGDGKVGIAVMSQRYCIDPSRGVVNVE